MTDLTPQDRAKIAAGRHAAETYCRDGMRLGLGSGTTSHFFVRALGEKVKQGLDIVGVPTSTATRDLALDLGIPLVDLDDVTELDVCVDGPDEIDPDGSMIKGGGACLLWEKIVATASRKMVVVADNSKLVARLGAFPLPVEVVRFGHESTTRAVRALLGDFGHAEVRTTPRMRDGARLVTDNGNYIIDVHLGRIDRAGELTVELNRIPGVVENGLFVGIGDEVVFGYPDGRAEVRELPMATA
ncbi:ribose-5-phosphate isomerase RpiA [Nonomuraea insulae]|uniref:Ribose-5-phosphate isomerase A n=1 Tax=Nonomuraea insulae TaxID=1616787 RepID=A0ABW1CM33_9ACTN